jgi:hypothetical protein
MPRAVFTENETGFEELADGQASAGPTVGADAMQIELADTPKCVPTGAASAEPVGDAKARVNHGAAGAARSRSAIRASR